GTAVSLSFAVAASRREGEARAFQSEADANAARARAQVCRFCVDNGLRAADEGDHYAGLLWFAEPLVRDPGNAEAEAAARWPIKAYWRHTARPVLTPPLPAHSLPQVAFAPDGRRFVAASVASVRVWDAASGQPVSPEIPVRAGTSGVAFSPDGRHIAAA